MAENNERLPQAVLYFATAPSDEIKERLLAFLENKYEKKFELVCKKDEEISSGFRLIVGDDVYDWTREGRLQQLTDRLARLSASKAGRNGSDVIAMFKNSIDKWNLKAKAEQEGVVVEVGDGIVIAEGLRNVEYGEIVIFQSGVKGMVQDLRPDSIGIILFGEEDEVTEGSKVRRTKKVAGVPVGTNFLGRVLDALGTPIDGLGPIREEAYRPIETPAPGIIDREAVNKPLYTGLLAIDSLFPIGRGQRELIIGDRQTGKTTIAVDTILNQKGNGVICIYVAIGQKASSVASLVNTLRKHGAMNYTIVINASASETAPMQYIAPYSGTAIGEYFMNSGKDVLIIYDDLSKHAIAYRAISLLLERSPGREAYPGDVFYLHSRLLERSAHLSEKLGGGSMTALPIVETQAGDVSAYIPTNIISITDGQIFLESSLFFSGQRPAVNVGLSVSRVGGAAQTKAMKKAVGSLRLDLAQFREMEVFTQFSNDLDDDTKNRLIYGQGLMRVIRQENSKPYSRENQIVLLVAAMAHIMQSVPLDKIGQFKKEMLDYFAEEDADLLYRLRSGEMSDDDRELIKKIALEFKEQQWQVQKK